MALIETPAKKPPIIGFCPQVRIWRAKKEDQRDREKISDHSDQNAVHKGIPFAMAKGWPRAIQQGAPWRSGR